LTPRKVIKSENSLSLIEFLDSNISNKSKFVIKGAYTLLMKLKNIEDE
jgi:hypothetical protein